MKKHLPWLGCFFFWVLCSQWRENILAYVFGPLPLMLVFLYKIDIAKCKLHSLQVALKKERLKNITKKS